MHIALITPVMKTGEIGGAEAFYKGLMKAFKQTNHYIDQIEVIIDETSFDSIMESYLNCYDLDLRDYDLVISTKAPSYMVRHHNHISYLPHTIRAFYDMFEREFGAGTPERLKQRKIIHSLDKYGLNQAKIRSHFTVGPEVFNRLYSTDPFWRQINFKVLHHPPALQGFKEPEPGEYIFLPGRLHRWKRADLIIKSFKYIKKDIQLKIAGTGEDEASFRSISKDRRIQFLGRVSNKELIDLYSKSLAVLFVPIMEDYGLITIESFLSKKPVITCTDSGGPTEFVRDFENGFVVEPDPKLIASKIEYLIDNKDLAATMGENGAKSIAHISWPSVISTLLASIENDNKEKSYFYLADNKSAIPLISQTQETATSNEDQITNDGVLRIFKTLILDMQPIEPPVGGARHRLLGLYYYMGMKLPATYIGSYDISGEKYRRFKHSDTLEEITIPLSKDHYKAAAELQNRLNGKTVIDVSFDLLAHLSQDFVLSVREAVDKADVVVFSHPWVYPLVKDKLRKGSQFIVYDSHNVESLLRAILLDDAADGTQLVKHVALLEYEICHKADLILACSHDDRILFNNFYNIPFSKMAVIPNGAFLDKFFPGKEEDKFKLKKKYKLEERPVILFIGTYFQPNVEAAEFICKNLAPTMPDINFVIAGGVGLALKDFDAQIIPNLYITGKIEESTKLDYFAMADMAINPIFSGSGTNIKMFEFMAAGLPVVSTPVGARGIIIGAEKSFIISEKNKFTENIYKILKDREYSRKLSANGRQLVEQIYSWKRISSKLGLLLHRSIEKLNQPLPFFSIIVATYERHEQLSKLLECLQRQKFKNFEIIIVDQSKEEWNGKNNYPDLEIFYIHTDVVGLVSSRNTGAFYARGEVLAFTDDDCQPEPLWLQNAVSYFNDEDVIGIEGCIFSDDLDDPDYRKVSNIGLEGIGFMTANLFLCREIFMTIDGFDHIFDHPHFREDTDLAWRALKYGKIPYGNDVRVYHPAIYCTKEEFAYRETNFEKDVLLLDRHPDKYLELFLREGHYLKRRGFYENFLRGSEKYGIKIDDYYISFRSE